MSLNEIKHLTSNKALGSMISIRMSWDIATCKPKPHKIVREIASFPRTRKRKTKTNTVLIYKKAINN